MEKFRVAVRAAIRIMAARVRAFAMTVFPLHGGHTGDLLLALPAIAAAMAAGPVTVAGLHPRYQDPLRRLPILFREIPPPASRPTWGRGRHRTDCWLDWLGGAAPRRMAIPLEGCERALQLIPDERIMISPWASSRSKRWHADGWSDLARSLRGAGHRIAWTGPPEAKTLCDALSATGDLHLVGRDSPTTWPALIDRARLLISPDSGAVHLADAIDVPVVGLYGFTTLDEFGPYWTRDDCVQTDMAMLEPAAVLAAATRVLERPRTRHPDACDRIP